MKDPSLLEAALEGLEAQKKRIQEQIDQVRTLLGRGSGKRGAKVVSKNGLRPAGTKGEPTKRELSPVARKRIAAAQKKRWAEFRKNKNNESA